jgi:hypothetical protein
MNSETSRNNLKWQYQNIKLPEASGIIDGVISNLRLQPYQPVPTVEHSSDLTGFARNVDISRVFRLLKQKIIDPYHFSS